MPEISVVIPTRQAAALLERALKSISAEQRGGASVEVIVVDQESDDDTVATARRYGAAVVQTSRPALYAPPTRSRNLGAAAAQGEFLLHLDADMTLVAGALTRAVSTVRDGGHVALVFEERDVTQGFWAASKALERAAYRGTVLEGARFVRAETFRAVGGYDETLGSGEDWDIHARYEAHGSIGRLADALEHHLGSISYRQQLRKKFLYGQSSASFLAKHESSVYSKAMVRAYADSWRSFARHPALAAGFAALRVGEAAAVTAGVAYAKRRQRRT